MREVCLHSQTQRTPPPKCESHHEDKKPSYRTTHKSSSISVRFLVLLRRLSGFFSSLFLVLSLAPPFILSSLSFSFLLSILSLLPLFLFLLPHFSSFPSLSFLAPSSFPLFLLLFLLSCFFSYRVPEGKSAAEIFHHRLISREQWSQLCQIAIRCEREKRINFLEKRNKKKKKRIGRVCYQ